MDALHNGWAVLGGSDHLEESDPQPTVLLIHPDPKRLTRIAQALEGDFRTLTASTSAGAVALMKGKAVDVVVADSSMGVGLLDELEVREPQAPRVLLFGEKGLDDVVEAIGDEHSFVPMQESMDGTALTGKLKALVQPRRHVRLSTDGLVIRLTLPGNRTFSRPLMDFGSGGLAFRLDRNDEVGQLLPGARLMHVSVWRGTEELLSGVHGRVRNLRALRPEEGGNGYRVGVELLEEPPTEVQHDEWIREWPPRLSLLRRAARRTGIAVERVDDDGDVCVFHGAQADARSRLLVLGGPPAPEWEVGDVVRGTFDLGGRSYSFLTSIVSLSAQEKLSLKLPPVLKAAPRRRAVRRHVIAEGERFEVELTSPWQESATSRRILDLSTSGCSWMTDTRRDVLPPGTRLPQLRVRLPDGSALVTPGRVRSVVRRGGPERTIARCGVSFEGISLGDQVRIADAILHTGLPGVEDANGVPFAELWSFFRETGFLYPEKLERLRPVLPQIEATLTALLSKPNDIFKALVFRNTQLLGHLSALRAYPQTWIVQHLATRHEGAGRLAAARMLNLGITDYSEQLPQMEWLRVYFRPNNRWPARVFGRFARRVNDPSVCDLRTFAYLVGSTAPSEVSAPGIEVRRAEPVDARWIEQHFVEVGRTLEVRAADLNFTGLELSKVSRRYAQLGLTRRREVWVAQRAGRPIAFALVQISSLGLNFSELTNAVSLHFLERDDAAGAALLEVAKSRHRELGREGCVALGDAADVPLFTSLGWAQTKEYTCWTGHRSLYRRYYEYILRLFERTRVQR
ncbi:MAG: PilZ domain-containing protein [Myxococcaceae bacterium]